MSQQSLLTISGIPENDSAIPSWAARVRDRVKAVTKSIISLETERQHLLSMLWDAGLGDLELSQEDFKCEIIDQKNSARRSVVSVDSVIDLISDVNDDQDVQMRSDLETALSCPPTPLLESENEDLSPRFTDDENAGDIQNIDPRELSFELPKKECQRVFNVEEWSMIDWGKMEPVNLKKCMTFFGIKPSGGKTHMINQMKEIFRYACGETNESSVSSTDWTKERMFEEFNALIQDNHELYEKIILFESVELVDVYAFLQTQRKETWKSFSLAIVREYLDTVGVQYSNTTKNAHANGRPVDYDDPHPKKRRRKRGELRKSISCP
jgi:hypothetical protein